MQPVYIFHGTLYSRKRSDLFTKPRKLTPYSYNAATLHTHIHVLVTYEIKGAEVAGSSCATKLLRVWWSVYVLTCSV